MPLCCGPLGVKRQPHSAALPPGLHLTLPQSGNGKRLLQDWPITALRRTRHLQWGGPPPLDPAVVPPSPPISQFFDTKITLAGRCNSHISGIFASVLFNFFFLEKIILTLFFFPVCYIVIFVYMQWSTKIPAAELALHCSYAETLWSEVPLYVHPVY